jgi:hypothetical protein
VRIAGYPDPDRTVSAVKDIGTEGTVIGFKRGKHLLLGIES